MPRRRRKIKIPTETIILSGIFVCRGGELHFPVDGDEAESGFCKFVKCPRFRDHDVFSGKAKSSQELAYLFG